MSARRPVRAALESSSISTAAVVKRAFSGPAGTGKTRLAIGIAYRAIQNGFEAPFEKGEINPDASPSLVP